MRLVLSRLDRLCARLNAGLAAVAIALALLLLAVVTVQAGTYALSQAGEPPLEAFSPPY